MQLARRSSLWLLIAVEKDELEDLEDDPRIDTITRMLGVPMHPAGARPLGPRGLQRSASPTPSFPVPLAPVAPLNIRKASKPQPAESTTLLTPPTPPLSRSPTPKLGLLIPNSNTSPAPSKPSLKLSIAPLASNDTPAADSPSSFFSGGYYGGPSLAPPPVNADGVGETTIRPSAQSSNKPLSMDDVRRTISDIESRTASAPPLPSGAVRQVVTEPPKEWSDDVLEEISRLGEGAGGAVHEVRDKRSGIIMARKTITTREAPMKQLLRELGIITSISHINIIRFYGAYMSPSSSEVKVVMEVCDGKSLEAVGKRIKERGARVGEKVAGRLAEGVCSIG